ncbi:MAG: LacI family DNA-binding transcriptional regulator [Clostridiaceae bacterium]
MKKNKTTISLIASILNISPISVSRALLGQDGVSEELRNKIILKADEMGYLKNKTKDIKVLVLHGRQNIQDNSNFSYIIGYTEKSLQDMNVNYSIEYIAAENQIDMYLPCKLEKEKYYDGVIFLGRFNSNYAAFIRSKIKSAIFYLGYTPSFDSDYVNFNYNNSGYKACDYLIENGHKKIGFIGGCDDFKNREYLLGINFCLDKHDLYIKKDYIIESFDNLKQHMDYLINTGDFPDAFVCTLDYAALKLIQYLNSKGIKVPDDISVIGCGNTEMSSISSPALTTIELNLKYSCEIAVRLLLSRIKNPDKPFEIISVTGNIIEKNSVKKLGDYSEL